MNDAFDFHIGQIVNYHSIIGGPVTSGPHVIEQIVYPPNNFGGAVAWLSGKSGCVSLSALSPAPSIATCIGCGCDDTRACLDEVSGAPCHWIVVDRITGTGVCSECPELVDTFREHQAMQMEVGV